MLDATPDPSKQEDATVEARAALAALDVDPSRQAIERAIIAAHQCLTLDGDARETGVPELLALCHEVADTLSGFLGMVSPAVWLQLRGIARMRLYELKGGLSTLISGVADLRGALDHLTEDDREPLAYVTGELAVALTRLGEQTSDLAPLHEALSFLDARLPFELADYRMANARAVAMMRIGAMAGDSTLVELAVRDLQAFVRAFSPTDHVAEMCDRNIAALLLENARQERSERVYRDLIRILEPRVSPDLLSHSDLSIGSPPTRRRGRPCDSHLSGRCSSILGSGALGWLVRLWPIDVPPTERLDAGDRKRRPVHRIGERSAQRPLRLVAREEIGARGLCS